jgi:hypothetical protein
MVISGAPRKQGVHRMSAGPGKTVFWFRLVRIRFLIFGAYFFLLFGFFTSFF